MGQGRKPKPTQLKVITGNPGKRALNENEPTAEIKRVDSPEHLSPEASAHWNSTIDMLVDARIMTELDIDALAMYCEAYARWVDANNKIKLHGLIVKSPNGYPMPSPYLSISNKSFEQMRAILTEFGMTPSSRTKIQVNSKQETNPFDDV